MLQKTRCDSLTVKIEINEITHLGRMPKGSAARTVCAYRQIADNQIILFLNQEGILARRMFFKPLLSIFNGYWQGVGCKLASRYCLIIYIYSLLSG